MPELLLTNGTLLDGTGAPGRPADVLIRGDRIAEVGQVPASPHRQVIDCAGLHLAPGFIDVHSHSDQEVLHHLPNKLLQGVTTEIVGNCGFSLFPTAPNPAGEKLTGEIFDGEPPEGMATAADYFSVVEREKPLVNVAALTGHVAVRIYVVKVRSQASEDELRRMECALDACLESGSIGFSTGLNCLPSCFGDFEELVRFCRVVRRHNGYYTTHMRDYKFRVIEAVDEAIGVARAADVPLQISHMQVVGQKNWHRLDVALEHIDAARRDGLDVNMDAYPYLAGSCSFIQFLPTWCQEGGTEKILEHLSHPASYDRIAHETDDYMSNTWDDLMISEMRTAPNQSLVGKSIARVSAERGRPAPQTALDLMLEEEGHVRVISFNNNEGNLRKVLTHPLTSIITDGMVVEGVAHPRTFGTYPKFLGEYVREKRWMPLEEAIVKTGPLAARRFRLADRGTLEPGRFADITVFDAARVGTRSDYKNPNQDPEGIHHVFVNGRLAVRDGKLTGERAGAALRHTN